jgi:ABC-2 type transport system ATP-binding protein
VAEAAPIEVRGLVKRYGELVAVDRVDLMVEPGDVFGYLGPSGAGKTTSLRMMQRLGIAAALLRHPRLLLLDEPATSLDPGGMRDMRELIRDLAARGITVLLYSHLRFEVEELCNRVAIVRRGSVVYEGALAELRDRAGVSYRLRTGDDERARDVCAAQPGIEEVREAPGGGLLFRAAGESAVGKLSLALGESGAPVLELSPKQASLEELFFQLTEGDGAAVGAERMATAAEEFA